MSKKSEARWRLHCNREIRRLPGGGEFLQRRLKVKKMIAMKQSPVTEGHAVDREYAGWCQRVAVLASSSLHANRKTYSIPMLPDISK